MMAGMIDWSGGFAVLALDLRQIREHWGSGGISVGLTLAAAGFLVLVVGVAAWHRWQTQKHLRDRPLAVFRELAGVGRLGWGDQWVLWRIARHEALPGPATLLFSTRTLRHHGLAYARRCRPGRRARLLRRVRSICYQLERRSDPADATNSG